MTTKKNPININLSSDDGKYDSYVVLLWILSSYLFWVSLLCGVLWMLVFSYYYFFISFCFILFWFVLCYYALCCVLLCIVFKIKRGSRLKEICMRMLYQREYWETKRVPMMFHICFQNKRDPMMLQVFSPKELREIQWWFKMEKLKREIRN